MTTIKMTELTKALQDRGLSAIFTMSGGNTGTIYIGEADDEGYYEFAVGPSNFYTDEAIMGDFCWGVDGDSKETYFFGTESEFTVENVANVIAKDYFDVTAFACGACGLAFDSGSKGIVAVNQGFVEFTCHGCKEVK